MPNPLTITDINFTPAPPANRGRGHLGWVSFVVAGTLHLDGVSVRRTLDDRIVLSFPVRHDRHDRQHSIVRPLDDAARRLIEDAVFAALSLERCPDAPRGATDLAVGQQGTPATGDALRGARAPEEAP